MITRTGEAERLIPYLYSLDARAAGDRLTALGAAAVEALVSVISGAAAVPDLRQLVAVEVDGVPLECIGAGEAPNPTAARERAAYLLGDIGDARAVEPLLAALNSENDRYVRLAMLLALGKIGDRRAFGALVAALEGTVWTPDFRKIVDDTARIGGEHSVLPLIRFVQREDYTYGAAAHAARALIRLRRDDPRVLDGLTRALRLDAEFSTLEAVSEALGELGEARGAQALLAFVREMTARPADCWDERQENLSETDAGVVFHVLKTELRNAAAAVRKIGDPATTAELERVLAAAPAYIPKS